MLVLIFDLGGGTFDVSLLKVDDHGVFEVKATAGDTHLGGQDLDNRMIEHCLQVFQRTNKVDISGNARSMARLKRECEKAKRRLSFTPVTEVVDCFYDGIDLDIPFTRSKFEELNSDLFDKCLGPLKQCLEDAKVGKGCVDEVVLVGGSTRIPRIREMVKEFFNGKELNFTIDPDEAVAVGAAIQAASLLDGSRKGPGAVLLDIAPLSLGMENPRGIVDVVVPRNTRIPCEIVCSKVTSCDNQTACKFSIYEGERPMACDNNLLGEFHLYGLRKAPKGEIQFLVVFKIDRDGVLHLSATNKDNQDKGSITITADKLTLKQDEISRMIRDARKYEFEDMQRKQAAEEQERAHIRFSSSNITK